MNIVSLLDSNFQVVLNVVKTLYNKLCDLISAFRPLVCGVLQDAVLSCGFYSVRLCLDVWS